MGVNLLGEEQFFQFEKDTPWRRQKEGIDPLKGGDQVPDEKQSQGTDEGFSFRDKITPLIVGCLGYPELPLRNLSCS